MSESKKGITIQLKLKGTEQIKVDLKEIENTLDRIIKKGNQVEALLPSTNEQYEIILNMVGEKIAEICMVADNG